MRSTDEDIAFERAMIFPAIFLLSSCLFAHGAHAQEYELGSTYVLVEILPQDAADLVKRADGCVHWRGEQGFDEERKAQIQEALNNLNCFNLQDDYGILATKYKDDITLTKALDYLEKYYLK